MLTKNGKIEQKWSLIYASDWKPEPKKGGFNKEFGVKVDLDFHITSMFGKKRYLDFIGRQLVIKTQNGRKSQVWYFHQ